MSVSISVCVCVETEGERKEGNTRESTPEASDCVPGARKEMPGTVHCRQVTVCPAYLYGARQTS